MTESVKYLKEEIIKLKKIIACFEKTEAEQRIIGNLNVGEIQCIICGEIKPRNWFPFGKVTHRRELEQSTYAHLYGISLRYFEGKTYKPTDPICLNCVDKMKASNRAIFELKITGLSAKNVPKELLRLVRLKTIEKEYKNL